MTNFDELLQRWDWRPIRNCPGRYVLHGAEPDLCPDALVGEGVEVNVYQVDKAADTVLVVKLNGGGLISYKKQDGSFVHTLNTPEGFRRKLRQLGIEGS